MKFSDFQKKVFFLQFPLGFTADFFHFLICHKFLPILCATCPKIKNFIWDNTLVPKVIKSRLVCICGHVAQKISLFPFRYGNFGAIEKSPGFTSGFERIFFNFWFVTNCAQFCVPPDQKSKKLHGTTFWYLKCSNLIWYVFADMWHTKFQFFPSGMGTLGQSKNPLDLQADLNVFFSNCWFVTNCAQFCVPRVQKSKILYGTLFWYLKCSNLIWYVFADMWHKKFQFFTSGGNFQAIAKSAGIYSGFEPIFLNY